MKSKNTSKNPDELAVAAFADYMTRFVAFTKQHSVYFAYLAEQYPEAKIQDLDNIIVEDLDEIHKLVPFLKAFSEEVTKEGEREMKYTEEFEIEMRPFLFDIDKMFKLFYKSNIYKCKNEIKVIKMLIKKVETTFVHRKIPPQIKTMMVGFKKDLQERQQQLLIFELQLASLQTTMKISAVGS